MRLLCENSRYTQAPELYETVEDFQFMCLACHGAPALLTHQPLNGRWIDERGDTVLVEVDDSGPAEKGRAPIVVRLPHRNPWKWLRCVECRAEGLAPWHYSELALRDMTLADLREEVEKHARLWVYPHETLLGREVLIRFTQGARSLLRDLGVG